MTESIAASLFLELWWVSERVGGHRGPFYDGMRTTVRWQRHVGESLKVPVDAQWKELDFNVDSQPGTARCKLSGRVSVPEEMTIMTNSLVLTDMEKEILSVFYAEYFSAGFPAANGIEVVCRKDTGAGRVI